MKEPMTVELRHLFDAELRYGTDAAPVETAGDREVDGTLGFWSGEFDAVEHCARCRAYTRSLEEVQG